MNLTLKKVIQNLLKKYRIYPSKRLGQNFLVNKKTIEKIIEAANLKLRDVVLEIGPGIGALTIELAERAKKVIAIEKDHKLARILNDKLRIKCIKNVEVVPGDILKIENWELGIENSYKVVANLPFYLTAPVIRKFLETAEVKPQQMVLMVQKEVAQRICASPPQMNLLAVSVQFYAKPEIVSFVPKKSSWPQPKVDSAILRITPLINADKKLINADLFFKIVRAGFSQPRKQLINNLSQGLKLEKEKIKNWLSKNNIKPEQRAETLTVENWISLTKSFHFVVK